ncbi:N-acetylmuramoyl-L-alanine amidase [Gemella sp. GH3]|uniref:N-acetylmuramoyl-L-alanine amidase n=1 Tax=unclassified Gemella TaxID=2624949 RepID=UPI0015D096BA|nr:MULTISPECIES: N-acetylmuramoyl-L-alanine amidase [unclassified Gemella]MBF0713624.1 N-acetylmuramoyl-L-alanine amidase [Gemella sp. GH3.1]NYS50576.1 N-acetylmuramoyl-L-alanine amidase [Gemella sp. GH3]
MKNSKLRKTLLMLSVMSSPFVLSEVIDSNISEANVKNGKIEENGKTYFYKNGTKQTDILETIDGKQYYFEHRDWGSNMAVNKWSYSGRNKMWYYSDANGVVTKSSVLSPYAKNGKIEENGKTYFYRNGEKQTDVLETINGKQYYFEHRDWGSNMAVNKWSYSGRNKMWYYSDTNGVVTKSSKDSPYNKNEENTQNNNSNQSINSKVVFIDPGHGGSDSGASYYGLKEKDLALQVYNKLYSALQGQGYTVLSSRTTDKYVDVATERSAMANRSNADIFISLHFNASGRGTGSSAQGIETYWYQSYAQYPSKINKDKHDDPERLKNSKLLAEALHNNLIGSTGAVNRGIHRNTFAVLRETAIPAVLLELGYMDNYSESQKIRQSSYQDKLVAGIVKGINAYVGNFSGNVSKGNNQTSKNGLVQENGKTYLYKNGEKQSDVLETINGKQYYFEPAGWGSNMAISKWSRSEKTNIWYYSDANGVVTKAENRDSQIKNGLVQENGKTYLYKNGEKQSDVLETINGKQYYFEPASWGSNMAISKWSRSEKTNIWYYSDANGVVTKAENRDSQIKNGLVQENGKTYLYKNGVKQSDVLEIINGKQYYFEPASWGSNMAISKWSRSEKTNIWYYSDANGVVTQTKAEEPQTNSNNYVTYYKQNDPSWGYRRYGRWTLAAAGCVPTSLSMAISTLKTPVKPYELADYLYNNTNYFNKSGIGTLSQAVPQTLSRYGLNYRLITSSDQLKRELANGHIIYAAVGNSAFVSPGYTHAVILRGIDSNGNTTVYNPVSKYGVNKYNYNFVWQSKSWDKDDYINGSTPMIAIY